MTKFVVDPYDAHDKVIHVRGPGDLLLMVDYDDVNPWEVEELLTLAVDTLNAIPQSEIDLAIAKARQREEKRRNHD